MAAASRAEYGAADGADIVAQLHASDRELMLATRLAKLYDNGVSTSYKRRASKKKAITVRVSEVRLRKVMRARKAVTQSELINTLLSEEEERLEAERALRATVGSARAADFDDRLL